jgi:hypothetical protein
MAAEAATVAAAEAVAICPEAAATVQVGGPPAAALISPDRGDIRVVVMLSADTAAEPTLVAA